MSGLGPLLFVPVQAFRQVLLKTFAQIYRARRLFIFTGATVSTMVLSGEYLFEISNSHGNSMYPTIPDRLNWLYINRMYRNGQSNV